MNFHAKPFCFLTFFQLWFVICNSAYAQDLKLNSSKADTLTISEIYEKSQEAYTYISRYKEGDFSVNCVSDAIRIYNTFMFEEVFKRDSHFVKKYCAKFRNNFLTQISSKIELTMGKGATMYSVLLDMYIGPRIDLNHIDFFIFWRKSDKGEDVILE